MASAIYYGKSDSSANSEIKVVEVYGFTTGENGVNSLNKGDLLVVLFNAGNTNSNPRLTLRNGDSNQDINIGSDQGIEIKVKAIDISLSGAWSSGETKIFVYTADANDIYYFEMIGSVLGDANVYGNVKVVGANGQADGNIALSPNGARAIMDEAEGLSLQWTSNVGTNRQLGTLALSKNNEPISSIPLYYPTIEIPTIENTRQIWNQGPKPGGSADNNKYGVGWPFLTRNIPANVTFYSSSTGGIAQGQIGLFIGDKAGDNVDNYTIVNPFLVIELVDANGNTNIFGRKNLTLQAAQDGMIITGGTNEAGRKGDMKVQGTLEVTRKITARGGFSVTSAAGTKSDINNLDVLGTLYERGHMVPIAHYYLYRGDATNSIRIYDQEMKGMRDPRMICTLQDCPAGTAASVRYVSIETVDHKATGYFTVVLNATVTSVSINYMYYLPKVN